jgi:hypothetical protein
MWGIPLADPGWVYAVRTDTLVKVGMTIDPRRRLLREAKTWCPHGIHEVLAKPFWNVRRAEYSIHSALAEFWHRGEWHKFDEPYWLRFFMDGFNEFKDGDRDRNSVEFTYWLNGTNFMESLRLQSELKMNLAEWRHWNVGQRKSAAIAT